MSRDIIERIGNATAERPIKGLALDGAIYVFTTKQEILDEQAIATGRVANLVAYARDESVWLVFNEDGSEYEEKQSSPGGTDPRLVFSDADTTGTLKTEDDGSSIAELAGLQGDRSAQAVAFRNFKNRNADESKKNSWRFNYYTSSDLYAFLPVLDGTLTVTNNNKEGAMLFTFVTSTGALYYAILDANDTFTDWVQIDKSLIQTHQLEIYDEVFGDNHQPFAQYLDMNGWTQTNFASNWVWWHLNNEGVKDRLLTISSSTFKFEKLVKVVNKELKVERVDETNLFRVNPSSDSASYTGIITSDNHIATKKYVDDNSGDPNWQLRNKISYDNATVNTASTGQGKIIEFLGGGSTSVIHEHVFDDSGVAWIANFQVTSARDKTVNVSSAVSSVGMTSFKVPVNMIARFSYCKDTNKMYSECSYIRPELIDYTPQNLFDAKSGYTGVHSGGGSTLHIEYWENGKIFSVSNANVEVKLLEGMDEDHKHGYVKYINTHGDDVNFKWFDRFGNQINNSTVPTTCPANTVVEIFANYDTNDYFLNFSKSKIVSAQNVAQTEIFKMAAATVAEYPASNFVIKTEE